MINGKESPESEFFQKRLRIAGLLQEIQRLLPNTYRVTLICRCTDEQYGDDANLLMGDDPDFARVAAALQPGIDQREKEQRQKEAARGNLAE